MQKATDIVEKDRSRKERFREVNEGLKMIEKA